MKRIQGTIARLKKITKKLVRAAINQGSREAPKKEYSCGGRQFF